MGTQPDFVSFYRWHVPDPIMFERDLKVTIQQIGAMFFLQGQEAEKEAYDHTNPVAGEGWQTDGPPALLAWGICERVDDYTCTSYVYCQEPQGVPPVDVAAAVADIERRPYEQRDRMEAVSEAVEAADAPPHRCRAGAACARRLPRARVACSTPTRSTPMIAAARSWWPGSWPAGRAAGSRRQLHVRARCAVRT